MALLATTHPLANGERVRLRLTRPTDRAEIDVFMRDIGAELDPDLARMLTFYDPRRRIVVAATRPLDGGERIEGLAAVALGDTGLADLGVAVAAGLRGLGLGTLLVEAGASLAAQRGATHLRAVLTRDDARMGRLMERLGRTVRTVEDGLPVVYARVAARHGRAA